MATKKAAAASATVIATATEKGFYDNTIRYPGETFAVPAGSKASWFETAETAEKGEPAGDSDPNDLV